MPLHSPTHSTVQCIDMYTERPVLEECEKPNVWRPPKPCLPILTPPGAQLQARTQVSEPGVTQCADTPGGVEQVVPPPGTGK